MNVFPISSALLDALVLAVTENEDGYGYKITKDIQAQVSVSESTLYPVLRRLQKNGLLETYDMPYMGRNRRYYRITDSGRKLLAQYRADWLIYKEQIGFFLDNKKGDGDL
jgi:PadR family transcriptional regulator PadR